MTKHIKYYLLPVLAAFVMMSCEDDSPQVYEGSPYVAFVSNEVTVAESRNVTSASGEAQVQPNVGVLELKRSGASADEALTVQLTVTAAYADAEIPLDAMEGINVLSETNVTFAPGEYTKQFSIATVNDDLPYGNKVVSVKITGVSDPKYVIGYPGPDQLYSQANLIISDDDCVFDRSNFLGTYNVADYSWGDYTITTAPGTEPNRVIVTGVSNWTRWYGFAPRSIYMEFNPDPAGGFTVTIPDQPVSPSISTGGTPLHYSGSGTYSPCSGEFNVPYVITVGPGGPMWDEGALLATPAK